MRWITAVTLAVFLLMAVSPAWSEARTIDILADKDSHYKLAGERTPVLALKPGEEVVLRITAKKGKSWNRDGSVHGFTLVRVKDRSKVAGWDLLLRSGTQEFALKAPEAGEYEVVCTVICSEDHEGMRMKVVVEP